MKKYLIGFTFAFVLFIGGYAFISPKNTVVNKEFCELVIIKDYLNTGSDDLKVNYGKLPRDITEKNKRSYIDIQHAFRELSKEGWKIETSFATIHDKSSVSIHSEGKKEFQTYILSREYTE